MNIGAPGKPSDPVTYLADHEQYEKTGLVTWSGNVQVWQGDHALRADKITYDRNTGVMAASGHVAVVDPDGTATYADYLELSNGMHDGIGTAIYMRMEDNAKIAANGMRRTEGKVNDLSHVIYTACQICETNRLLPPFWQIRAYNGTHDVEHHRIEFEHGWLDMLGIPVIYFPVFSMTDPTVKRQSGFLIPGISPHDRYLGTYITIPYFWAIDQQQDLTAQLLVASRTGPQLSGQYRNALNFGNINFTGAIAYDTHGESRYTNTFGNDVGSAGNHGIQGYVRGSAQFAIDDHWRAGLNLNLASSANYMRDYRITGYGNEFLNSTAYLEGFGVGSYTKLDTSFFQGLNQGTIRDSDLPFVLPRLTYDFQGRPDALGGTFSAHTTDFNVYRPTGARDQRGELQMNWDRPFHNKLGQQWLLTLRLDSTLYHGSHLYQQPLFYESSRSHTTGQVLPTIALKLNWPFLRTFAKGHGSQILEPIVQAIYAPNTGYSERDNMPNEDSLGYEFTDSTLFSLNRYLGTDRLDGGLRGNVGIHSNWIWNGHVVDLLVGESLQEHITRNMPAYSGLDHHVSDPVGRIRISPSRFVDLTARGRYNPWKNRMDYGEGLISTGTELFHVNGGYVYEPVTPYYYYARSTPPDVYYKPISELSAGISSRWHEYHVSVFGRRALKRKEFVSLGGDLGYNNDCFGLDIFVIKQYTSIGGQQRNTTVLFNFTFKTIGTFGING
ncbi:LPS assembly protein LptD [Acetobacteraceae bacterium LMG 32668]|uniref:LPS-assembly protein LptD n=2 Tax=Brytella acorum TaxID=2959299 RepID=A0AA35VDQ0_9PROT|nr:LPS assembly protein LptD [Brytella acorum]MDF3623494.1 LPS assembly protein LptD [Brytella acorum]CAI9121373.1 LPS assembly protein LptD [Brytella acorum]